MTSELLDRNGSAEGTTLAAYRRRIQELEAELEEIRARLAESEETLTAIRRGEVDAVVVGEREQRIYTLENADRPYRVLIEQIQEGALTLSAERAVLYCNRRFAEIVGEPAERVIGRSIDRFVAAEERSDFEALLASGATGGGRGEFSLRRSDERFVPVYISVNRLPDESGRALICGVVTDLTQHKLHTRAIAKVNERLLAEIAERERTEALLRQAQKMEAVGQLTGGLAHDFNNLLTAVMGNLELIQRRVEGDPAFARQVGHAMAAAERGAKLTQQLLAFSRRQHLDSRPVCVGDLAPELEELIRRAIGLGIDLRFSMNEELWHCRTDSIQLEAAVLNLAINARDAMPAGGQLTISAENIVLDERAAGAMSEAEPGQYVAVSVTDTGTGMPPEVVARALEPFYTTKEVGKGSGLGLSMVYGFAKQCDGHITIESEVGRGTTVRIYLPRAEVPMAGAWAASQSDAATGDRKRVVLVIEDDAHVRDLAVQLLEGLGYTVRSAANGADALLILAEATGVDVLFSDIVMPGGMNGIDLAREARRRFPNLAILLTSGFTNQSPELAPASREELRILRKPYRREELAEAIRAAVPPQAPTTNPPKPSLRDLRVLLVEDEPLVALVIHDILEDLECMVMGPIARLDEALERARSESIDIAILDVNLAGQAVYPVADVLASRGVPFVFATGYGDPRHPEPHAERPTLAKPFGPEDMQRTLFDVVTQTTSAMNPSGPP